MLLLCCSPSAQAAADTDAVVSFLGPTGTYTEQVADAVSDVLEKRAVFAVIPQENTIGGPVYDYLDSCFPMRSNYLYGSAIIHKL